MNRMSNASSGATSAVYGLGLIGSWIYYFTNADGVVDILLGILRGVVWPAILVYEALGALGA